VPVSEAQLRAVAKYKSEHYEVIKVNVPKGEKAVIRDHAYARNESLNQFVYRAILETMTNDVESPEE